MLLLLTLIILCSGCESEERRQVIKIGYLLCNSEQETLQRFSPLTSYLSEKTGTDFILVPVELHDLEKRFAAGEFSFVRTNSLIFTRLNEQHGARLLAAEKRGTFGARTAGVIIAGKESGIRKLEDLKGKTMAFGAIHAPAGYLAEYALMLAAGIDPEKDLGHYTTPRGTYKHEKLVYGVLYGAYDVAAVPLLDLELMTLDGKISADDVVILAQSSMIPYCAFAAAMGVDRNLFDKVRKALIDLQQNDTAQIGGERIKVMKAAGIDGYELLAEREYEEVRGMAKRVAAHLEQQ